MKNKRKYRSINSRAKNLGYAIYIISAILLILGIVFINLGFNFENKKSPIFNYTASKSIDYNVLLKPNDFYDEPLLPSKRYYAAKSVDSYIVNFEYDFKESKKTNINYTYNITCEIVGILANSEDNKEIWSKTFNILPDDTSNSYKDNFSVKKQIKIDYDYYNNLARSFEEAYGILIDSTLKVRFNIKYNTNLSSMNLNDNIEDYIELSISLTDTVTHAEENLKNNISKEILPNSNITLKIIYYVLGTLSISLSITFIIIKIKRKNRTPEQIYKHNINKVLKYYKELIVTVTNEPNLKDLNIMELTSLDDLIDVAEQSKNSIIHYETNKNKESKLYVIINEYVYIYTITSSELK